MILFFIGNAATPFSIVNASDSSYTDACKTAGTLWEFCCMTDKVNTIEYKYIGFMYNGLSYLRPNCW